MNKLRPQNYENKQIGHKQKNKYISEKLDILKIKYIFD